MSPIGLSQGLAPHLAAREPFLRSFRLCFARSDLGSASSLPVSPAARMPSVCVLRGTFIEEKEKRRSSSFWSILRESGAAGLR